MCGGGICALKTQIFSKVQFWGSPGCRKMGSGIQVGQGRQNRRAHWGICWQLPLKGRKEAASSKPPPCITVATPKRKQYLMELCGAPTVSRDPACAVHASCPTLRAGGLQSDAVAQIFISIFIGPALLNMKASALLERKRKKNVEESLRDCQVEFDSGS